MTLVNRMTLLSQRLSALPVRFGIPQYQGQVVLRLPSGGYLPIDPNPEVIPIDARRVGSWITDTVQVLGDEVVVRGIHRVYLEDDLSNSRWLLNAVQTPTGWTGKDHRILWLGHDEILTWHCILAPRRDV